MVPLTGRTTTYRQGRVLDTTTTSHHTAQ